MKFVALKIFIDVQGAPLLERIVVYLFVETALEMHQKNAMMVILMMVMGVHSFVPLKLDMVV